MSPSTLRKKVHINHIEDLKINNFIYTHQAKKDYETALNDSGLSTTLAYAPHRTHKRN